MKLKHACTVYGDYGLNISADEYVEDGIPLIRTSDFDDRGKLNLANAKAVPREAATGKLLRRGDILFSRAGTIGRCLVINEDIEVTFAAYLVRFRPHPQKLDSRFVQHWAQSDIFWSQIRIDTIESTIGNFNATKLSSLALPPVELQAQRAIAEFLDDQTARIDQLVEKREAFLALIEEKKQTLAAKAVSGELIVGNTRSGPEGWFGRLPSGWSVRRAKFLFRERQDRSDSGDEELLTVSHITGVTRRSEKDVNMFLAESQEGYKLVCRGDIVINTMWAWMGAMGVSPVDGLISPSYGVYNPTTDHFVPEYIELLLRSRPFITEVNRRSKGVWSSRLRLYPDAFLDILLPVPSREEQEEILTALGKATLREEKLASLSRQSLDRLREFRSALITAAVTGQIDVTTWTKRGEVDRRLDQIEEAMRA
ncbi:MAG TPA: restriction endonuclease subunit S [Allosphingosinicella sp.]|nr:restriction endonuclease subunit S [Allosphingosinicella sp.]